MKNEETIKLIDNCLELIATGKTDVAISLLRSHEGGKYSSQFTTYANRVNRLKKELNQGMISMSAHDIRINQINAGLVKTLQAWKDNPEAGPKGRLKKWHIYAGIGVLGILILVFAILKEGIDCGEEEKVQIHIANFERDDVQGKFSKYLYPEVDDVLNEDDYQVRSVPYLDQRLSEDIERYKAKFFDGRCQRQGLIILGDYIPEEKDFICQIKIANLYFKVNDLDQGADKYRLRNPDNIELKVGQQAKLIADFIKAILMTYAAENIQQIDAALYSINNTLSSEIAHNDKSVASVAYFYKGIALAMKGELSQAKAAFIKAKHLNPRISASVDENLEFVAFVQKKAPEKIPIEDEKYDISEEKPITDQEQNKSSNEPNLEKAISQSQPEITSLDSTRSTKEFIPSAGNEVDSNINAIDPPANKDSVFSKTNEVPNPLADSEEKLKKDLTTSDEDVTSSPLAERESEGEELELDMSSVPQKKSGYKTVKLKDKETWMVENLNINVPGCYCYDNDPAHCAAYGRLYTFEAAKAGCNAIGMRLPTDEEWEALRNKYGGREKAYNRLIEGGSSGFDARLGGYRSIDGSFLDLGDYGYYWSATEADGGNAFVYNFYRTNEAMNRDTQRSAVRLLSTLPPGLVFYLIIFKFANLARAASAAKSL